MLSRVADSLYWMSRYIERAENIARLLEVGYRIALLPHEGAGQDDEWRSTLRSAGCEQGYLGKYGAYNTRDVVNFMLFDPDNASSVYSSLATARRNARAQRTALTREMWECMNSAWITFSAIDADKLASNALPPLFAAGAEIEVESVRGVRRMPVDDFVVGPKQNVLAVFIERAAHMQVLAQSIGKIKPIDPGCAREAHDYRLKPRAVAATFHYFARRALRQGPEVLE